MSRPRTSVVTPGTPSATLATPRPQGQLLTPGVCEYASTVFTVAPGTAVLLTAYRIPRGGHIAVVAVEHETKPQAGSNGCCCATPANATLVIRSANATPWFLNTCNSTTAVTTPGTYRLVLVAPTQPGVVTVLEQHISLTEASGVKPLCDCPPMCLEPDGCGEIRITVPPGFMADVQAELAPQTGLTVMREADCSVVPALCNGHAIVTSNTSLEGAEQHALVLAEPGDYRIVTNPTSVCQTAVVTMHCKCC